MAGARPKSISCVHLVPRAQYGSLACKRTQPALILRTLPLFKRFEATCVSQPKISLFQMKKLSA
jgi:hypothetical protein